MMSQRPLFLPDIFLAFLREGADCGIGLSGGKDSQALVIRFIQWYRTQGFTGRLFAIWANLGRAERTETPGFIDALCKQLAVPLEIVRPVVGDREGDLEDSLTRRKDKLAGTGTPFWPTLGRRYCSALKRGACDKAFRSSRIIASLEGIRADESDERAEKEPFTVRETITGVRYKTLAPDEAFARYLADQRRAPVQYSLFEETDEQPEKLPRLAFTLYPLFQWNLDHVWDACSTSQEELNERRMLYRQGIEQQDPALRAMALDGWSCHPAYVKGARRLSCSLCILSDEETLRSGAYNNPVYYRSLVWYEIESGFPFQQRRWLADVAPELLTDEQVEALANLPQHIAWLEKKKNKRVLPIVS
jgi:3'-phosphoadenosine 5'-phosphosulfate sulfotransferase (PAPS reductase)/FAD synthetase